MACSQATCDQLYIQPLRQLNLIEETRLERFIRDVFLNIGQLHQVNLRLSRRLNMRRKENPVVGQIGDIFTSAVSEFLPYIEYGARQIYAKHFLAVEKMNNPEFAQFLEERERMPESRKLPLESFLARPTTHMGRYPLLLEAVLKRTDPSNPDRTTIPQAIAAIKDVLKRINQEAGKADNLLKLNQLNQQLVFAEGEWQDLRLTEEGRTILRQGVLISRKGNSELELVCFLFDHLLLLAREKRGNLYKVYKKPLPLELINVSVSNGPARSGGAAERSGSVGSKSSVNAASPKGAQSGRYPLSAGEPAKYAFTIGRLGKDGAAITLFANSIADRRAWIDTIEEQKRLVTERKRCFDISTLAHNPIPGQAKVTCSTSLGAKIYLGADTGVYVGDPISNRFSQVLDLEKVTQLHILSQFGIAIILADRILHIFPLEALDSPELDVSDNAKKGRRISSHVSFFKVGICNDRMLICAVKSTTLSSTIKVFEPVAPSSSSTKKSSFLRIFRGSTESVKVFKVGLLDSASSLHNSCPSSAGVLHSFRIDIDTFLENETLCRLCKGI